MTCNTLNTGRTTRPVSERTEMTSSSPKLTATGKTVLVVDDERDLLDLVSYNLARGGYTVLTATDGSDALEIAMRERPNLILLDLMLPGIDGTEVARRLRSEPRTATIPIIMLTAKAEEIDIVVGLTVGADDYVTKPFSMKVLLARVQAALRREETGAASAEEELVRVGPLTIDSSRHDATIDGKSIRLTLTEFRLLSAIVTARGRVLNRNQLMDKAIGTGVFVTDRAIDVHITSIRKKLGAAQWLIHTVRGVGYRLQEAPDAEI